MDYNECNVDIASALSIFQEDDLVFRNFTRAQKIAYLAAFFDSEGCIHITKKGFDLVVYFDQSGERGEAVLGALCKEILTPLLGTSIKVQNPETLTKGKSKRKYRISIRGEVAYYVLVSMYSYLTIKKGEAELAIVWYRDIHNKNKQNEPYKSYTLKVREVITAWKEKDYIPHYSIYTIRKKYLVSKYIKEPIDKYLDFNK